MLQTAKSLRWTLHYLVVLNVGVFGISYKKNWHLLNYLSFVAPTPCCSEPFEMALWTGPFLGGDAVPDRVLCALLHDDLLFNLVNRKKSSLLEVLGCGSTPAC